VIAEHPPLRLSVPAYFHPAREADCWARLKAGCAAGAVEVVVVNPDSGVGAAPDDAYREGCAALRQQGLTLAGYVDTAYASRPLAHVLAEARAYAQIYGVTAVFADQVTSSRIDIGYYRRLCWMLRAAGATLVVLNPGVAPDPEYLDLADVVVTFEGPWDSYADQELLPARRRSATTWHLVHSTPAEAQARGIDTAHTRGASHVYVTEATLPNPWDGLPDVWDVHVAIGATAECA
jgi:Spherulation-specific family 4